MMNLPSSICANFASKNLIFILFVKGVILTALVNFYMVSLLPDAPSDSFQSPLTADNSVSDNHDAAPMQPREYQNPHDKSWICVRQAPSPDKTKAIHGRRLKMRDPYKPRGEHPYAYTHIRDPSETHIRKHFVRGHPLTEEQYARREDFHREYSRERHDSSRYGYGGQCEMYPCTYKNGIFVETPGTTTGYAGKFVHRETNVTKSKMRRAGGNNWASGCVISHKYKFIYIHVLKSGGTATKEFIRKSLCGENDSDCHSVHPDVVRHVSCRTAVLQYPEYFTFSFVRNPFSRMYSMYSMMDGFPIQKKDKGRVTEMLPFGEFVSLTPKERKRYTKMHPSHYYNQTEFVFSRGNCPSFDYLGRVEHFDEDMRIILRHVGAVKMIEYLDNQGGSIQPANNWGSKKKQSVGGDLRSQYSSQEVIEKVASLYKSDFSLLGYDTNKVPVE